MFLKIIIIIAIIVIGFFMLSFFVYLYDHKKRMKNRVSVSKIEINSKTLDGENFTNSYIKNNTFTIVNLWGTYCGFCKKELLVLQEIFEEYKDKNIGVIGIIIDLSLEEPKSKILSSGKFIIDKEKISFPNIYLDKSLKEYLSGKIFFIPTTIIVDEKGNVIEDIIENICTKEELKRRLDNLLNIKIKKV